MPDCPFCEIIIGRAPATIVAESTACLVIVPLNPVVDGHVLVMPRAHVIDAIEDPWTTAQVMRYAAMLAHRPCNIITSAGAEATQTIDHLHVHIVPRRAGDGLALPWSVLDA